jgi:hypothetical protein
MSDTQTQEISNEQVIGEFKVKDKLVEFIGAKGISISLLMKQQLKVNIFPDLTSTT